MKEIFAGVVYGYELILSDEIANRVEDAGLTCYPVLQDMADINNESQKCIVGKRVVFCSSQYSPPNEVAIGEIFGPEDNLSTLATLEALGITVMDEPRLLMTMFKH